MASTMPSTSRLGRIDVYREPGPMTTSSAFKIACAASGLSRAPSGFRKTWLIGAFCFGILDSPSTVCPLMEATSVTSCRVDGMMVPLTASTLPDSRSACSKFPVTSAIAMMKRLPKEWPSSEPSVNRWSKSCFISGSASASAMRHCRKSPGGRIRYSSRSLPDDPPSSATVTMADRLEVYVFRPRSSELRPVPPPMATMRGPRLFSRKAWIIWTMLLELLPGRKGPRADSEGAEDGRAQPVRKELEGYVVELVGQLGGCVKRLEAISESKDQHQLREHEEQKPTLDLETRCQPPEKASR